MIMLALLKTPAAILLLIPALTSTSSSVNGFALPPLTTSSHSQPLQTTIPLHSSMNDEDNNDIVIASPSGINVLPNVEQQLFVAKTMGALGLSTAILGPIVKDLENVPFVGEYLWHPELLGPVFILAGAAHFFVEDFLNIMPPIGTWGGLWQLPGSPKFHVYWTGVAEVLGGVGLLAGKLTNNDGIYHLSAACLLALSFAVYPANLYMWSHGAELPKGVPMESSAHIGRYVAQIVLCSVLASMV